MALPPASTSRSTMFPTAGLEARPLVASVPPHFVPTIRALSGQGTRCCWARIAANFFPTATAFSTVFVGPPSSWITNFATGFPVALTAWYNSSGSNRSQPRPTTITAPALGWQPMAFRVLAVSSRSRPTWEQPTQWVMGTAPGIWAAIFCTVELAQNTEGRITR